MKNIDLLTLKVKNLQGNITLKNQILEQEIQKTDAQIRFETLQGNSSDVQIDAEAFKYEMKRAEEQCSAMVKQLQKQLQILREKQDKKSEQLSQRQALQNKRKKQKKQKKDDQHSFLDQVILQNKKTYKKLSELS